MKFIMLINFKMPTIVGILTFISMINATFESFKGRKSLRFIFQHFSFYKQLKFNAQLSWAWRKFYNLGAWTVRFGLIQRKKIFQVWKKDASRWFNEIPSLIPTPPQHKVIYKKIVIWYRVEVDVLRVNVEVIDWNVSAMHIMHSQHRQ